MSLVQKIAGQGILRRFRRNSEGMALVEFAMILPIMVLLYLGGVAVTQGIMTNRKVVMLNHTIGDLVTQNTAITNGSTLGSDAGAIFGAASAVMAPYSASSSLLGMRMSSVRISSTGAACVEWSLSSTSTFAPRTAKSDVTSVVPIEVRVPSTWLIMAESTYAYTPIVGIDITGTINMQKIIFMRARQSSRVTSYSQTDLNACSA